MSDSGPRATDSMPGPLFSAERPSDATASTVDPVPGNQFPVFLAAPAPAEVPGAAGSY